MITNIKFITKCLGLFILPVILFSCNEEDLLDKKPLTQVTETIFWEDANNLKLYANGFYQRILPGHSAWAGGPPWQDANSDNLQLNATTGLNNWIVGTAYNETTDLGYNFGNIRTLNIAISNFGKYEGKDDAKQYMGEIYFFRAFEYFGKLKLFGDYPYITERVSEEDKDVLYRARTPRYDFAKGILADLDKAIPLLSPRASVASGRINKESAMALKSRVALFEGTWEKYHKGTAFGVQGKDGADFIGIAATVSKKLIDGGALKIYNTGKPKEDYKSIFINPDLSAVTEAILWKKYNFKDLQIGTNLQRYTNGGSGFGMTKDLVESYLCTDGKDISQSTLYQGDASVVNLVKNRDSRLIQSMVVPGVSIRTVGQNGEKDVLFKTNFLGVAGEGGGATGYTVYKYRDTNPEFIATGTSISPWILFRYAEVLLNYAEAKAELGTLTQGDLDLSINKLRARVGMPNMEIAPIADTNREFPGVSALINEIRRERRVEMVAEGYRLDDLRRWAAASIKISGKRPRGVKFNASEANENALKKDEDNKKPVVPFVPIISLDDKGYVDFYKTLLPNGYGFKPTRDYLAPIPLSQRQVNSKLTQNPGW